MSGSKQNGTVQINEEGTSTDLPMVEGTVGPKVIDIRKLYAQTGHFTYDPGFTSTASCDSAITYIDGDQGILMHRGYKIEELAAKTSKINIDIVPISFRYNLNGIIGLGVGPQISFDISNTVVNEGMGSQTVNVNLSN